MIPPSSLALYVLLHSIGRIGAIALRLVSAALGLDLLLHGMGQA
ncbi:MAG: hypothetical protein VKI83_06300 [Synechococcaceae cyanobacterium]|nr:hypothetical protein [Synechococcaceae cyanobacterium]